MIQIKKLNLVSALADGDMPSMQLDFQRALNSVDKASFLRILKAHCPQVATLCKQGNLDVVESIFFHIDTNGDGFITWDELFDYAVTTANQNLQTIPAERVHPYLFSRSVPRVDNVLRASYFHEPDLLMLSSRHSPVQLLKPSTMHTVHQFSVAECGGPDVVPVCTAYLPGNETFACFFSDMKLRMWSSIDRPVTSPLKPVPMGYSLTRLRTAPSVSPYYLYSSDSHGNLSTIEVSRQVQVEPRIRSSLTIHDYKVGGVADFCVWKPLEHRVISSGFDHNLLWTDLTAQRSTVVGTTPSVLKMVQFFEAHQCIVAIGHDNGLSSWVTHQSQKPCTILEDPSKPHLAKVIGLECVPNTPQVITADAAGVIKIWDLRKFQCAQTFSANEGFNADGDSGMCRANDVGSSNTSANSFCYLESTKETCCVDAAGIHFHTYNKGAQPQLASHTPLNAVRYNPLTHSIMTLTATAVQVWDADQGFLQLEYPKSAKAADLTAIALDGVGRRMFLATQSGDVDIKTCNGGQTLKTMHRLHAGEITGIDYSSPDRALVSVGIDGFLTVWVETDTATAPHRLKLSTKPLLCVGLSSPLSLVACGGKNGKTFLLDVLPPRNQESELKHNSSVRSLTFLGSFPILVTGHANSDIIFWSVRPIKEETMILVMNLRRLHSAASATTPQHANAATKGKRHDSEANLASTMSTSKRFVDNLAQFLPQNGKPVNEIEMEVMGNVAEVFPSSLAFDPKSHHLFIASNKGRLHILKCCNLLQSLKVPTCNYPQTPPFSIAARLETMRRDPGALARLVPTPIATIHAHKDEIVDVQMIPHLDVVATCGEDHRVLLFDVHGNWLSELSQGRIPTISMQELAMAQQLLDPSVDDDDDFMVHFQQMNIQAKKAAVAAVNDGSTTPIGVSNGGGQQPASKHSRRPAVDRLIRGLFDHVKKEMFECDGVTVEDYDISASSPSRQCFPSNNNNTQQRNNSATRKRTKTNSVTPTSGASSRSVVGCHELLPPCGVLCTHQCFADESCPSTPLEENFSPNDTCLAVESATARGGTPTPIVPLVFGKKRHEGEAHLSTTPQHHLLAVAATVGRSHVSPASSDSSRKVSFASGMPLPNEARSQQQQQLQGKGFNNIVSPQGPKEQAPSTLTFPTISPMAQASNSTAPSNDDENDGDELTEQQVNPAMSFQALAATFSSSEFNAFSAAIGGQQPQGKFKLSESQRKFSPRLRPSFPVLEGSAAEANGRHLVTLLRNLGDISQDWLSEKERTRLRDLAALGGDCDPLHSTAAESRKATTKSDGTGPGDATVTPCDPTITETTKAAPRQQRHSFAGPTKPSHRRVPLARSAHTKPLVDIQGENNGKGQVDATPGSATSAKNETASREEEISWRSTAAKDGARSSDDKEAKTDPSTGPSLPPPVTMENLGVEELKPHSLSPTAAMQSTLMQSSDRKEASMNSQVSTDTVAPTNNEEEIPRQFEPDVDLSPPSYPMGDAPRQNKIASIDDPQMDHNSRRHSAHVVSSSSSFRDGLFSSLLTKKDGSRSHRIASQLGSLVLSEMKPPSGPLVAGPLETLQVLHAAWTLSQEAGGTALYHLGIGDDKMNTTPSATTPCAGSALGDLVSPRSKKGRYGSGALRVGIARLSDRPPTSELTASTERTLLIDANSIPVPVKISATTERHSAPLHANAITSVGVSSQRGKDESTNNQSGKQTADNAAGSMPPLVRSGIHSQVSPRSQSGNVYASQVRHGHVSLGPPRRAPRPPPKPDAKSFRIAILEDELKRCLLRQPTEMSLLRCQAEMEQSL